MADPLSSDLASLRIDRDAPVRERSFGRAALTIAIVVALGAAGFVAWPKLAANIYKIEVTATEVAVISPVQGSVTVTSTGYVVPQVVSKLGAKVPGRVRKVNVREGSDVKAGDVVAELEDSDQKSAMTTARSRVNAARARAEAARATMAETRIQAERTQKLVDTGSMARATLDDLLARKRSLEEQIRASEAEVRASEAEEGALGIGWKDRTIVSPIDGRVVAKPVEVGELVGPQVGYIAEIADFKSLMVETDVPESRLHMVKLGGPCEVVLDAYPDKRYRGIAAELGQRVNRAKATVTVKVKFEGEAEGVLPEMSARVAFLSERIDDAKMKEAPKKVVSQNAIVQRDGKSQVFVIDSGAVKLVPVNVGAAIGASVELLDGPNAGAKVVSNPPAELSNGSKIKQKGES
ncbi:MAG: efflux RND transporter periplasmic adaptor subunit [Polyangiaceae bacterium]